MASLLFLDLGTLTGYALASDASNAEVGTIVSGTQSFKNDRYSGGGMRYLRFRRWLDEMHAAAPIGEVAYEEVRNHKGVDAAHVYGGLMGQLTAWCEEHKIPYEGVPVSHIKKFATGKGNAGKEAVIEAVRSWGYEPVDDNEADAIAGLILRISGSPP
jgi:Holliday junction resolvasome RuvABC endonuclease subunit